jgi:hypothetical protein
VSSVKNSVNSVFKSRSLRPAASFKINDARKPT